MSDHDEYKQMIHQIREVLTSSNYSSMESQQQPNNLSDFKIKQYLAESYQIVQKDQFNKPEDPHLIYSKISQASVLLTKESDMIKNYVKDKIQAQVFSVRKPEGVNQKQYEKLIETRQKLQKKRLEQKLQESKKIDSMIQSARKFKNYENKAQVPLPQLQSLLHKQRAEVDNILKEDIKIKSSNNQLFSNQNYRIQPFGQKIEKKKSKISKQEQESFQIQVVGIEQDENTFLKKTASSYDQKISENLRSNKNFLKIFAAFLTQQIRKMQLQISAPEQQSLLNTQKQKKKFRFSNELTSEGFYEQPIIGIRQLSHLYKFKVFVEARQQEQQKKVKDQLIKKLISKRIGTSNKYHMKQCIIKDNVFYYSDEQSNEGEIKLKDMKSIQIGITPIEQKTEVKEEGSFFQNKENQIEVIVLKGVNRDFVFQLDVGQGPQLKLELSKINLRRIHKINCILGGRNYQDMGKFIENQFMVLNFSQNYLKPREEYPQQQMRQNFIKLVTGLFFQRQKTSTLNFSNCGLSLQQLKNILKQCEKNFTNVETLNFSHTKLDKQTLKSILSLIMKCSPSNNVKLNLDFCGLDDDVIEANLSSLSEVCSKTKVLELAGNELTSKSIKSLRNILASKVCEIQELNLSKCLIQDFGQLANLIKAANKLQIIKANSCSFTLNNQKHMQSLLSFTSQKQQLKQIQLRTMTCTGTIKWFQEISPYLEVHIDLPNKFGNKSLESKFVRVSLNNLK